VDDTALSADGAALEGDGVTAPAATGEVTAAGVTAAGTSCCAGPQPKVRPSKISAFLGTRGLYQMRSPASLDSELLEHERQAARQ
jgi:hypothetical protein